METGNIKEKQLIYIKYICSTPSLRILPKLSEVLNAGCNIYLYKDLRLCEGANCTPNSIASDRAMDY